ncbi:hypothetical protein ACFQ6V_00005 [Streptomyces roseifaciens]
MHSLSVPGIFTKTRKAQRDGFAEVIRRREMSLTDWDIITEGVIRFPTEDEMYAFLQASYDYFMVASASKSRHRRRASTSSPAPPQSTHGSARHGLTAAATTAASGGFLPQEFRRSSRR